jgi:polyphenol oxidase
VNNADIQLIEPDWPAPPGVRAAFTLRSGGVSVAPYNSLNLGAGIGDSLEAVAENRRRLRARLGLPAEPVWLEQVHGVGVVQLGDPDFAGCAPRSRAAGGNTRVGVANVSPVDADGLPRADADGLPRADADGLPRADADGLPTAYAMGPDANSSPRADAAVAHAPAQVCAIRVADCMPVLFAALDGSVVGAAHAGWRGLASGVLEATVERLDVPSSQLVAWMGPAIGPGHFEVGDEVRAAFTETDAGAAAAFVRNAGGRWQCDLYALARRRLGALGLTRIYGGGWCTFAESDRFFSYRRDGRCGRMAALIWMEPERT